MFWVFFPFSTAITVEPCRLEKLKANCTIKEKGTGYYRDCYKCIPTGSENCYPSRYKLENVTYTNDNDDYKTLKMKEYVVKNCTITHEAPLCITFYDCKSRNNLTCIERK